MKHKNVSDELILELLKTIDGQQFKIDYTDGVFEYFVAEPVIYQEKPYRLVLLLCIVDDFLGVVNAFRVRRKKL